MLFDPARGAADRKAIAIIVGVFIVWLTAVGTMAFVAVHFIIKYW